MSMITALIPLALAISPLAGGAPDGAGPSPGPAPAPAAGGAPALPGPLLDVRPVRWNDAGARQAGAARPAGDEAGRSGDPRLVRIQAPDPSDRGAIIDRVARALSDTRTAQGRFTQVDPQGAPASGVFYINRPGKVRFEYTSPEPIFIVSDGVSVSIEEPRRKSYDAVPLSSTPLNLFLRSNIDLRKDGSVAEVTTSGGSHFVTLVDKSGQAQGRMILQFRQTDFELIGWRQIDGAGAETRVQLTDVKKNVAMKPALFIVKDPADAEDKRR